MDAWVEKCDSSSKRGRRRRIWIAARRRLAIVIPALVLTACSSAATSPPSDHVNQRQAIKSGSEAGMERFKNSIERLSNVRFGDIDALNEQLHTHLGKPARQGLRDERTAERGMLGGLEVRNITLRSAVDNPAQAKLTFDVAPPSVALKEVIWEGTAQYPPRPDAPDSLPYWTAPVNGAEVVLTLAPDNATLTHVLISQR
ncbi:hypothetical protein [Stenotrophomonas maltophilia]|uniref:hypothetical protein n=1 Tax=Stenotrophomonas maltophilia TaxID=40324 RepID=UPI00117CCB40|nr:hypothetical protein [Stenotrophomonas maltophilia]MDW7599532.1 hypothetical protein [Stenotrophomonas maltophilia]QNA94501.1 hypothetical protein G4G30_01295 [Stenotrophomonas maltophilia]